MEKESEIEAGPTKGARLFACTPSVHVTYSLSIDSLTQYPPASHERLIDVKIMIAGVMLNMVLTLNYSCVRH